MTRPGNARRRTRDEVAQAALDLLDEHGLPDLTMRNLAEGLGVQPSALYWHFPNKQALLAAVSERILAPLTGLNTDGLALSETVHLTAAAFRERLLAYRDGAELVSSSLAFGLIDSPVHQKLVSAAHHTGIAPRLVRILAETLTHFTVGHAFHQQQHQQANSLGLLTGDEAQSHTGETGPSVPREPDDFEEVILMILAGFNATAARGAQRRDSTRIPSKSATDADERFRSREA